MRKLLIPVSALTIMLCGAAQSPDVQLQAAIKKELVDGDLKAAIEQYKRVVAESGANRAVAARALLQMANCYQKLGDSQARNIYERILKEYGDQKEAATVAGAHVKGSPGKSADHGLLVRQVWTGTDVNLGGSPSPDGRLWAYSDWNTENLVVRDLETGEQRVVVRGPGKSEKHFGALHPVFSPDGKRIAYQWHETEGSIRVVGVNGSGVKVLADALGNSIPRAWSPDGTRIAVVHVLPGNTHQIAILSTTGERPTQLKSINWRWPTVGTFSPDGKFLVYSLPRSEPNAKDGGIFALASDGSREIRIVDDPAEDAEPRWTPDGRQVVFVSRRSGQRSLWMQRVRDGEPQGAAELLRPNIGDVRPLGFTRDGDLYWGTYNQQTDVVAIKMASGALKPEGDPALLSTQFVGSNWGPAWSRDGRQLAFFRAVDNSPERRIVIRSAGNGHETVLPFKVQQGGYVPGYFQPEWAPDGKSLYVAEGSNQQWRVVQVDVRSGEARPVFEDAKRHGQIRVSPDGKWIYYSRREGGPRPGMSMPSLMKKNVETGDEVELYRAETPGVGFFGLAISPDGGRLLFSRNDRENGRRTLLTISTAGGPPHEIFKGTYNQPHPFFGLWSPDGKYVLFAEHIEKETMQRVWIMPAAGGEAKPLPVRMRQVRFGSWSPDGRQIAFTGGTSRGELAVVHNLLSR